MNDQTERQFMGVEQLSLRSLILGMAGSALITASSMYVALRMSALPWSTIFVAVLSMALLKILGRTTLNEINITQTSMSAGAMVAGGIAFTLPGLWITKIWDNPLMLPEHFWQVFAISLAGMLLGTVATWFLRPQFIEQENLPYPIGIAAAQTISAGDAGGKKASVLFGTMGISALLTFFRDQLSWFPAALSFKWLYAHNFFLGIWLSPMAAGIGYMIGPLFTGVWFVGAALSYLLIIPLGTLFKLFPTTTAAIAFKNTAGIGLMIGTGAGILLSFVFSWSLAGWGCRKKQVPASGQTTLKRRFPRILVYSAILLSLVLAIASGIPTWPSVLLIFGITAAAAMAAIITGETGINPMEIFGIIVVLTIRLVSRVENTGAFFIAAGVAIASGYAGDLLNDYKTGKMLGTNPVAQLISQIAGGIVGALVASVAMFAIISQFGGVGPERGLSAGQAFAVAEMVHGVGDPLVLSIAIGVGAVLYLLKVPAMTLGLGLYLSFEISAALFLGGLLRWAQDRFNPQGVETGNIAASGFFGGEGVCGVLIAIFKMVTKG
ncbi:MAG TPA: OPT/YSL family transporter [Bacillota bacterium]